MSREIEFRLWIHDKRNKKGNMYYAKDFGGSQAKLLSYWENRCIVGEDFLEQYTGLKDKNGKKMDWWEGDLLLPYKGARPHVIAYDNTRAAFRTRLIDRDDFIGGYSLGVAKTAG